MFLAACRLVPFSFCCFLCFFYFEFAGLSPRMPLAGGTRGRRSHEAPHGATGLHHVATQPARRFSAHLCGATRFLAPTAQRDTWQPVDAWAEFFGLAWHSRRLGKEMWRDRIGRARKNYVGDIAVFGAVTTCQPVTGHGWGIVGTRW
jgi:hypothetical protein